MAYNLNPFTGKLDESKGLGLLDGRYILKSPTAIDVNPAAVPADFAWQLLNTEQDGSGVSIYNSEYGIGLMVDLEQNANFVAATSGGFRGNGLLVKASSDAGYSTKSTGLFLSFSGKSSSQAFAVHNEFIFMHSPGSIVPKKMLNFGGGNGEGGSLLGVSRGTYNPGTIGMMSAHTDFTGSFGPDSATRAASKCHGGVFYIDRLARLRLARQSMSPIPTACGVGWGDENILLLSNVNGMTTLVNQPCWPFSIDAGGFEMASGNTKVGAFILGAGDSEQWNTPFWIKKVYEKGTLTGNTNQITGTAGNTFITTPNSVALFTAGDLVQLTIGAVKEYHEITSITGAGPYTVNFARPLEYTYTGATNNRIQVPAHNAIKIYNPGAAGGVWYTTTKQFNTQTYYPATIQGRGSDWIIVGEVTADTTGWRIPFGNPSGRGQIAAGAVLIQIADADITNALDNVQITPITTTAVTGAPFVNGINAPAGTFTVNVPVMPGVPWDFMYSIQKYEMPR